MSDRNLTEITRAMKQRFERIEADLAKLKLRGWGGAVRTANTQNFTSTGATPQTVVNLPLSAGRWAVWHSGRCTVTAAAPGLTLLLETISSDTVTIRTPFVAGWTVGTSLLSFCDFGLFTVEESDNLQLQVSGAGFSSLSWQDLSLMALPV